MSPFVILQILPFCLALQVPALSLYGRSSESPIRSLATDEAAFFRLRKGMTERKWFPINESGSPGIAKISLFLAAFFVLVLLVWQLSHVLLLLFAAVLFAILLRSLARLIERFSPVGAPWSLVLSVLVIGILFTLFIYLLGSQIASELKNLIETLPEYAASLGNRLGINNLPEKLAQRMEQLISSSGLLAKFAGYSFGLLDVLVSLVLVVMAGIYLAANPRRYERGVVKLVPEEFVEKTTNMLSNMGHALQYWLFGQLISMTIVSVLTTVGLYLIGVPSPLALGILAGLAEFVPIVGPVLAAVPALLLAFSEGGTTVLWVAGLYLLVQQLESNVILPLVQDKAVDLPPVVTLFAVLAFGVLFGPLGVLLGTPFAVFLFVAVEQLYVRNVLGKQTSVPGETEPSSGR